MIIAKYLLKNIFEKPLRTLLLVFCMASCVFVALFGMDMMGSMEVLLKGMLTQVTGSTDVMVSESVGVTEPFLLSEESSQLLVYSAMGADIVYADGEYTYYHKMPYTIYYTDYELAAKMRLYPADLKIADDEAVISPAMQIKNGHHAGDTLTLYDEKKQPHEYKITAVLPMAGLANGEAKVFLSKGGYEKICRDARADIIYIDVADDTKSAKVKKEIEEQDYNAQAQDLMDQESMKEEMRTLSTFFVMIFMVCFFLVIFVSFSVSKRIVCERMAVVGTFRSLGFSSAFTAKILLLENALYGFLGALSGIVIYLVVRTPIFRSVFSVSATSGFEVSVTVPDVSPVNCLAVLLAAVVIMLACPVKSIIATSKTAIRDIIFDNKDTAYKMGRVSVVVGFISLLTAAATFFATDHVSAQLVCFGAMMIALALLFPYVLKLISGMLSRFFEKMNMPIAKLASREIFARKSTVGSSVLCVTAATLAIVIFIFLSTLGSIYKIDPYRGDVIVYTSGDKESKYYSYIKDLDGVKDVQELLCSSRTITLNGKKREVSVFGLPAEGYRLFAGFTDYPDVIEDDAFVMDRGLAKKLNIAVGDEVEICFDAESFLPFRKKLKLKATADCFGYDTTGDVIMISRGLYESIFHAYPGIIIVKCDHPEKIVHQIETYSASFVSEVRTRAEEKASWKDKESGMKGMVAAVICIGVGLSFIGMVSNQLIGFEGRKRECAVLASVAMTRSKISKMFMVESALAAFSALIVALPVGLIAFVPLRRIMIAISGTFMVTYKIPLYILFEAALWFVFTFVALFPISKLRKMKLAKQLKYE